MYEEQYEAGRYVLHEHPLHATSWQLRRMADLMARPGVELASGDQCQYGQTGGTDDPVKQPTGWMSNSPEILAMLKLTCKSKAGGCTRAGGGEHRPCIGDVARMAAIYPMNLCKAIIQGCRAQLRDWL